MAGRWDGEFAHEDWAVDPLDMMTADDFEKHLVVIYGPDYLGQNDYARTHDGLLVPTLAWEKRILRALRDHPKGLTKYQIKMASGASRGTIDRIVREPMCRVVGAVRVNRGSAELWSLNKEKS